MKTSFTLCLLCASIFCFGQTIPNGNFNQFETIPCPFNDAVTIQTYKDWTLYQTLDDHWDGPIDSSICINLAATPSQGIDLQSVDINKPIFARCKFTESNKVYLSSNMLYNVSASTYNFGNQVYLEGGTDCTENMCSGLIVGIQIPDEPGTGTHIRWYADIPSTDASIYGFDTCVPTEYFANNYLRELIIKMKPKAGTTADQKIKLYDSYFYSPGYPNYISNIVAPQFTYTGSSYQVPVELVSEFPNSWEFDFMLRYTNTSTWPSSMNPSYVEGIPEVNTPDPQTINLIVDQYQTFVPQPFAFLRGALVEGSDTIRHEVNLINNGGDMCLGGIIDFVFDDNTKYIHKGGHVNMEGLKSCMMFRNGGTFEVAEGVTMQYGQDGRGILALRSGGQMILDKGSTLLFDGTLWLQGIPTAKHPDPQFYLDLKPGTSLIFSKKAGVLNANSSSSDVKLNVFMNGGILDDSRLNPTARLLINRIYPKPSNHFSDNVKLIQNPSSALAQLEYISLGQEQVILSLYDLQGRYIASKNFNTVEGHNHLDYDISDIVAGIYMLHIKSSNGSTSLKLIKY
ncbi:MAG: T9SS type A sorting domain-containing protein [Bacteroidetes bacterium]|nr:T9SS type A sorting domain-containing protein [Bacteroidota bacterium]